MSVCDEFNSGHFRIPTSVRVRIQFEFSLNLDFSFCDAMLSPFYGFIVRINFLCGILQLWMYKILKLYCMLKNVFLFRIYVAIEESAAFFILHQLCVHSHQ